jgi:hypothetical protein
MNSLVGQLSCVSIVVLRHLKLMIEVLHCQLHVLGIKKATQEEYEVNIFLGGSDTALIFIRFDENILPEFLKLLRQVLFQAEEVVLIAFVALAFDEHGARVEVLAVELSHITDDRLI